MKAIHYLFSVVFLFVLVSCSNDEGLDKNNYSPSALVFKTLIPDNDLRSSEHGYRIDTTVIFSGQDIAWFNETTGELRFNDNFPGIVMGYHTSVHVFWDKNSLFNLMLASPYMSLIYNTPVLSEKMKSEGGGFYIQSGYPDWDMKRYDKEYPIRTEREENWKNLIESKGWKLFIEQLKKEGRYKK